MRTRDLVRIVSFSLLSSAAIAQTDRDFSGRWFLKPEKSELQALPEVPDPIIRIDQEPGTVHLLRIGDGDRTPEEIRTFSLDGRETKRRKGEIAMSSQTKWEGAALLINTIVNGPRDTYTVADRWRLSRDHSRLTISRHIIRGQSEAESTLVYEREARITPPVLITSPVERTAAPLENSNAVEPKTEQPELPVAPKPEPVTFLVPQGTKVPLRLINSVSTKHSSPGDRVYLETVYPILSHGHVIIPPGSYVMGSLTEVKQAGRVKGKSSFFLRFDSLTLPNGTTRDFRSHMSNMPGDGRGTLDRREGEVKGEGGKGSDARTAGEAAAIGTSIGAIAGSAAGHAAMGAGIGAAAGAVAGLAAILSSRGPDAVLDKGSTIEMVLDRDLAFTPAEVNVH